VAKKKFAEGGTKRRAPEKFYYLSRGQGQIVKNNDACREALMEKERAGDSFPEVEEEQGAEVTGPRRVSRTWRGGGELETGNGDGRKEFFQRKKKGIRFARCAEEREIKNEPEGFAFYFRRQMVEGEY